MLQALVPIDSSPLESEADGSSATSRTFERLLVRIAGTRNARLIEAGATRSSVRLKLGWRSATRAIATFIDRPSPTSADEATRGAGVDPNPLGRWRTVAKRSFAAVGTFSIFVNLLMLTLPLYLFQLSDRVLTSRSLDTLLMLSVLAISLIAVLSLVDIFRREMLGALANRFQAIIGGPVVASVISSSHIGERQRAGGAQPQPRAQFHFQPDDAAAVRCAAVAAVFRGRVRHQRAAGAYHLSIGAGAHGHRGAQPALYVGAPRACRHPQHARRRSCGIARAQLPGNQRNGHDERRHPALGQGAGARAFLAVLCARSQFLDQRDIEVLPPDHADRRTRLGRLSRAFRARSPAA